MEGYIVSLIIFTAIFALFSLGLNLQWGFTGLINFGHVAFMVVGSYLVVILTTQGYLKEIPLQMLERFTWMQATPLVRILPAVSSRLPAQLPIWVALLLGALSAALLGLLMGLATLRLREDYLAIVTIGMAEMLRLVALNEQWLTRGTFGIQQFPLPLSQLQPGALMRLLMIAVLTAIAGLGLWRLWRWAARQIRSARLAALMRGVAGLLAYLGALAGAIAGALGTTQIIDRAGGQSGAVPDWGLSLILLSLMGLVGWLAVRLARRFQLAAQGEAVVLTAAIAIGALGLWVYGYAASALYHYDRNPTKTGLMWLCVVIVATTYAALQRLVTSPWGRVLKAIREDEQVARALGKNAFWYKLQSLMLGGAIAGVAGALYAWQLTTVYPDNFRPLETFNAWTIVVLGGAGSNAGTLLGAAIFWTYQTLTRFTLEDVVPLDSAQLGAFRIMVIGLLLMVMMIWRPQGILGRSEELTLDR
ncbi:MAG: branched-chain amino acid ABC transporter permease [Elainellaceae cyanobacterium]